MKKKLARRALNLAIPRGEIVRPGVCSHCGESCRPEGHHPDYDRPLEVVWLCSSCHKRGHNFHAATGCSMEWMELPPKRHGNHDQTTTSSEELVMVERLSA